MKKKQLAKIHKSEENEKTYYKLQKIINIYGKSIYKKSVRVQKKNKKWKPVAENKNNKQSRVNLK